MYGKSQGFGVLFSKPIKEAVSQSTPSKFVVKGAVGSSITFELDHSGGQTLCITAQDGHDRVLYDMKASEFAEFKKWLMDNSR